MSKTIYDVKMTDLIAPNYAQSPKIKAVCAAFDATGAVVAAAVKKVQVLCNLAGVDKSMLNYMALQQHVDYYRQGLSEEIRRGLIEKSGFYHRMKGTAAAVEQAVKLVFGSAEVQEWFEYGGDPYMFRVTVNEFPDYDSQLDEVKAAIAGSQNIRSHLDEVIVIAATANTNAYMAGIFQISVNISINQEAAG